ncbi:MAG: hypothetical protein HYV93_20685 [Candidatus Rokubacteria bacterium]|nr:hypothetical protein [Candidatus Rokubacteria bacterium]
MRRLLIALAAFAAVALWGGIAMAGEYHSGQTLYCYDCHTMHFSQAHKFGSGDAPSSTPAPGGDWLGTTGPNHFLLKAPANELCMACHDGQSFAPDVVAANANASPTQGRQAGAVNSGAASGDYAAWKGHTLGATSAPPGYNPSAIGAADWYNAAGGLECISCHAQHGPATSYRNLGPYALGGVASSARPTYTINTANDTTKDVWVNLASYAAGSGAAATFNPYYDRATVNFNRNDATVGSLKTSNKLGTFCAACHANFHGGPGDANIGASDAALDGFIRHPTSQVTIGAAGAQGYGGHSSFNRYRDATTKVKTFSNNSDWTNASPGCITCHKAHGNNNPFGLIFLNRAAASVDEEGGLGAGQTASLPTGMRNLCGQCHGQGN